MSLHYSSRLSGLLLLIAVAHAPAAELNVRSDAASNPAATSCPLASACTLQDALRIAQGNGQDDTIRLQEPSSFGGGFAFTYTAAASDVDRDLIIVRENGLALFDAGQAGLFFDFQTSGTGDFQFDGLTLTNSRADYTVSPVFSVRTLGDIQLQNCAFSDHRRIATQYPDEAAAAAYLEGRLVQVDNCGFLQNRPGAVRVVADRAEIQGSHFSDNGEPNLRGRSALQILAYSALVADNSFLSNLASGTSSAGALQIALTRSGIAQVTPTDSSVSRNLFDGNSSGFEAAGGAVTIHRSGEFLADLSIDQNVFRRNSASAGSGAGAGISGDLNTRLLVRSNLLHHNEISLLSSSAGSGSGLRLQVGGELHMLNNTVVRNSAQSCNNGAIHITSSNFQALLQVHNNILRDNEVTVCSQLDEDLRIDGDPFTVTTLRNNNVGQSSLFPGQQPANLSVTGELFVLPTFVDENSEDFHLAPLSELIDAGSMASNRLPASDIDGQARVQNGMVDVGADEFAGTQSRLVSVSKLGAGSGSVGSIPSGLVCNSGCTQATGSFDLGSTIGLVALASPGSVFSGWGGDCSGSAAGTTLLISGNHSCTARFEPQRFRVTVRARGTGQGDVAASQPGFPSLIYPLNSFAVLEDIVPGTSLTFTAANLNSPFSAYWVDCETQGGTVSGQYDTQASCTFNNLQGNKVITVEFSQGVVLFPTRNLSVTKLGAGNGQLKTSPPGIDCTSSCNSSFFLNTEVTLFAPADGNSYLAEWGGDCAGPVGENPFVELTMSANLSCTVRFEPAARLTVGVAGNGDGDLFDNTTPYSLGYLSSIGPFQYDPLFPLDSSVLLTATAATGSYALFLDCDQAGPGMSAGGNGSSQATCEINQLNQDVFLNLLFVREQHLLTVQAVGSGSGSVAELGGALALIYPDSNLAESAPLDYGTQLVIEATAVAGDVAIITGCSGQGSLLSGQGSAVATCRLGMYQATVVQVEFRAPDSGDAIFSDGFE